MRKDLMDMTIEELVDVRETAAAYLVEAVRLARKGGSTWKQIGEQLGVSHQEAHRKYSWTEPRNRTAPPLDTGL